MGGDEKPVDRRTVLKTAGGLAAGVAIAGCSSPENEGGEETTTEGDAQPGAEPTTTEEEGGETTTEGEETTEEEETTTEGEETTEDGGGGGGGSETVAVGPDGEFVFRPGTDEPLEISTGTTVTFVWESDTHNIAVQSQPDGANWEGHEDIENTGFEYEHTFDTAGEYEYVCEPHEAAGMVGSIVVE